MDWSGLTPPGCPLLLHPALLPAHVPGAEAPLQCHPVSHLHSLLRDPLRTEQHQSHAGDTEVSGKKKLPESQSFGFIDQGLPDAGLVMGGRNVPGLGQQECRLSGANLCCVPARFELENQLLLEQNQRCLFASNTAMQWLDIRLQMIGVAVVTAIAGIAIIQHQKQLGNPGRLPGIVLCPPLSCDPGVPPLLTQSCTSSYTGVRSIAPAPCPSTSHPQCSASAPVPPAVCPHP